MFSPFNLFQFKILAESLYNNPNDYCPLECNLECIYPTIINRSYYASFLYAMDWLEKRFEYKKNLKEIRKTKENKT